MLSIFDNFIDTCKVLELHEDSTHSNLPSSPVLQEVKKPILKQRYIFLDIGQRPPRSDECRSYVSWSQRTEVEALLQESKRVFSR